MNTLNTRPMVDHADNAPSPDDLRSIKGGRPAITAAPPDFEQQWLEDYLNGDDSGFLSLYHRYKAQLYRYLLAHMGVDVANRLFVQTWIEFLNHSEHLPHDISPGAALFAEAHRLLLEGYRTQDKSILLSFADGVVETVNELAGPPLAENSGLEQTQLEILQPAWREALQIYLETGFDGDSLAYALHVSRETARSRLKRAFNQWRKSWPDGDGVEDTLLRSTQHWIHRYRSLVSIEPPDYLDARILRHADWHTHWLPRLGDRIQRYWHIGLTIVLTAVGVFGYLWTMTAAPSFTLELTANPPPKLEIASTTPASVKIELPAQVASVSNASVIQPSATQAIASSNDATTHAAQAIASSPIAKPKNKMATASSASAVNVAPLKPHKTELASSTTASAVEASSAKTKTATPEIKTRTEYLNQKVPSKETPNASAVSASPAV